MPAVEVVALPAVEVVALPAASAVSRAARMASRVCSGVGREVTVTPSSSSARGSRSANCEGRRAEGMKCPSRCSMRSRRASSSATRWMKKTRPCAPTRRSR